MLLGDEILDPRMDHRVVHRETIRLVDVYDLHHMRTNIEIDSELIARVMRRYGLPTKRAAVDLALRRLDLEPMGRDEALSMRGTGWDANLAELREGQIRVT